MKNYYDILGIPQDADPQQIKKAYRELARQYHPDSTAADQPNDERFIEATEAYRSLIDPFSRAKYDHTLRQLWRVDQKTIPRTTHLSTDNIRPFMWILATVLSFAAFMLCVFTALLIEFSPEKSSSRNAGSADSVQNIIETSEAEDRASLRTLLSVTDSSELSCTIDLVNTQTDCDAIPLFTFFSNLSETPRFRITLNPSVAIIQSLRVDIQTGNTEVQNDAWLLHFRDLRPNTDGDSVDIRVRRNRLSASQFRDENGTQIGTETLMMPPKSLALSDHQVDWIANGDMQIIDSPLLFQFPVAPDEETIDLWIGINRPLDDHGLDASLTGNIERVTISIVVVSLADEQLPLD